MKARDLAKLLLKNPEEEIDISISYDEIRHPSLRAFSEEIHGIENGTILCGGYSNDEKNIK